MPSPLRAGATLGALTLAVLLLASCTGQRPAGLTSQPPPSSTTTAPAEIEPVGTPEVFEVGEFAVHPNGVQLRVERVEVFSNAVVVQAGLTNGSPFGVRLDRGTTELRSEGGVAELVEPLGSLPIPSGEDVELLLRFGPLEEPGELTLVLNRGGGSSPVNPTTEAPTFEVGPFTLDARRTRPPLPDPVRVERNLVHPLGPELRVEGIAFTPNRIGLQVRVANPTSFDLVVAPTIAPAHLEDDLGNRYSLISPEGERAVTVPAGEARAGVLAFAGRIHPDATVLSLGLNDRPGGGRPDRTVIYPRFRVEDMPLAGEVATAVLPEPLAPEAEAEHPAGVRVELRFLRFQSGSMEAGLMAANDGDHPVGLAVGVTAVVDDLDNAYPLVPPTEDALLAVDPSGVLEGTLVFSGRLSAEATEVTLVVNAGPNGSAEDPETLGPAFRFGPYPLERSEPEETGPAPEAPVFSVGAHSRLFDEELTTSEVEQVVETLARFNAVEVEEGFMLTLPDDLLFDFNSAELRSDARQALALIAEVLEYFEGDPVRVIGHTDSIGSASYNQRLSEERAQNVVEALVTQHGVGRGRLSAEGRGASEPVAPNTTPEGEDDPEGRQLNRRVEIVVVTDRELPGG